uniref:AMP-dependent synthetase/ligase domain-containing protein n=1 Tax=Lactuca sativa TaxID=4236 RepID=A0A9R1UG63_LACSA|nr:hypothetical protein LSAT_V11C900495310 [Lactuca sativa]
MKTFYIKEIAILSDSNCFDIFHSFQIDYVNQMGLCFLFNINTIDPKHYYFFILITRIGVVAKPCAEFVAGVLAIWLNGGVAVPLALSYPEAELLHVMTDSDVSMILSTDDHRELMQKVAAKTVAQFSLIPNVPTVTSQAVHNGVVHQKEIVFANNLKVIYPDDDPTLILYTSGTTGKPKGVVHTHSSILAQVKTLSTAWEYTSSDRFLHCLPLHHILK